MSAATKVREKEGLDRPELVALRQCLDALHPLTPGCRAWVITAVRAFVETKAAEAVQTSGQASGAT